MTLPARAILANLLAFVLFAGCLPHGLTRAQGLVDLELVLTVDVSLSMDVEEQRLQRDGYVAAFRDPEVWRAIASGPSGRIAVTYVEWAGATVQATVLPWTLIDGPVAAQVFADALEAKPISRAQMTSISGALLYAASVLNTNPFKGRRQVVDVSGDGPNNAGATVELAREALLARGIVINGLPIQIKSGGPYSAFDIPNLDQYYSDCVIGGPGAFSLPVRERGQLATAIRRKLILEISGLQSWGEPSLIPAQAPFGPATPQAADCLIGEKMWHRYMRERSRE